MSLINILFTIPAPRFTDEQQEAFAAFGAWEVLNERGAKLLIDAVGPEQNLSAAIAALASMGRSAKIVGGWRHSGQAHPQYPVDVAEWLATAPDEVDTTDPDHPVHSRPTQFREVHQWQGWGEKSYPPD